MKKINLVALSLCFALMISALYTVAAHGEQRELAGKIVRLHIVAHSDSDSDQRLKLQVRDRVAAMYAEMLSGADSQVQAEEIIREHLAKTEEEAGRVLRENGCDLPVKARLVKMDFPERHYDDVTLPAGEYDALRVVIGEGAGRNWWCVIFPQLCINATNSDLRSKAVKAGMTDKELELLFGKKTKITIKFKLLELLNKLTGKGG